MSSRNAFALGALFVSMGLAAAATASVHQLHNTGAIYEYTGQPCQPRAGGGVHCGGWRQLDGNPQTRAITAGGSGLYQLHDTGAIYEYTGQPCQPRAGGGSHCGGWRLLDAKSKTRSITAGGKGLYKLLSTGAIYEYTGQPCQPRTGGGPRCGGWRQLDGNSQTRAITAGGASLYQLHATGAIYAYTGQPCQPRAGGAPHCGGWRLLDALPKTQAITTAASRLYKLHRTGAIYEYTGQPCERRKDEGTHWGGWRQLEGNRATVGIAGVLALMPGLTGWVDLHTHPMSHLGFGRKALHGAPDVGMIVPAGTRDCNEGDLRATSMAQALGHCNSTHGGWGTDNGCGDYLRATIISKALDADFEFNVGHDRNLHGDHEHAGYPNFAFWPHHSSVLHQQMWWEWLKRARDGGLRVMVALTVNSETLAEILNGDGPYDDKTVADIQIAETIRFVGNHPDFMEIAYSAADVRRIVRGGRWAVVPGMEVAKLGNFGKPGVRTDEAAVRAEIQRLHRAGVRYVFPIHLIDNSFGGTAVYEMLFNFANKHQNGEYYRVASDPSIGYGATLTDGPFGAENALILALQPLLRGIGHLTVPCFNDLFKCSPPPGKLRCCGSYESILSILAPSPQLDAYRTIPLGHVNRQGLSPLGEVAVNEMMRLGMIIDVDHMSERSLRRTLELASAVRGGYPLVMGHNGLREPDGNERAAPRDVLTRIFASGGMLGLGTAGATPHALVASFDAVAGLGAPPGAIAIGSDANGFEPLPKHNRSGPGPPDTPRPPDAPRPRPLPRNRYWDDAAALERESESFYSGFFRDSGLTTRLAKPDGTSWDYVTDGGVSHYGLMPEFLYDVKTLSRAAHESFTSSSEYFATMWERIEAQSRRVGGP